MKPPRVVLIGVSALAALALFTLTATAYTSANDWAARVDGHEIGERAFLDELAEFRKNDGLAQIIPGLGEAGVGTTPSTLASDILSYLVSQAVVEQIAVERGIRPTREQVSQAEQVNLQAFGSEDNWNRFPEWFRLRWTGRQAFFLAVVRSEEDFRALLARLEQTDVQVNPKYGTFELTPIGPSVVPPVAPQPPGRLPVRGAP